jgi:DNA-binding winged helix-turn-helix (wHTH) protein
MQKALLFLMMLFTLVGPAASAMDEEHYAQHEEVVVRMIGHQVLRYLGDSTSAVPPVQRDGGVYTLRFSKPFGFQPELVADQIDGVIASHALARHYIVAFLSCDSDRVVYSYEQGLIDSIVPCMGRPQPVDCYRLRITLLERNRGRQVDLGAERSTHAGGGMSRFLLVLLVLIAFAAGAAVRWGSKPEITKSALSLGAFSFDPKGMCLYHSGDKTELTGKETDLLLLLYHAMNATVERDDILREVWGDDGDYIGRTLDVFISKLRKKLERDPNVEILNVRGVGYRLVVQAQG